MLPVLTRTGHDYLHVDACPSTRVPHHVDLIQTTVNACIDLMEHIEDSHMACAGVLRA